MLSFIRSHRLAAAAGLAAAVTLCGSNMLQDAVANGDTRTITLHHVHSGASASVTFKRNGRYDPAALQQLNVLLQDWRRKEPTKMDPALFDIVWEVYRETGATEPIQVIGGYRSPETNSMLRARSRGVAKSSMHMLGRAMDFYIPGVPLAKIREAGLRLQRGGVGFYPTSGSPFVHLDTGGIRHWPRMTRDQLARVFPDGKTVHVPADGKPMSGYATALAQVEARGNEPGGAGAAFASAAGGTGPKKNFFTSLFNKDSGDDDEESGASSKSAPAAVASAASTDDEAPAPSTAPAVAAAATTVAAASAPNVPLPMRNPMATNVASASPEALAAAAARSAPQLAAAVPLPLARPGEAPARPAIADTTLAMAATPAVATPAVPLPLARPGAALAAQPAAAPTLPAPEPAPAPASGFPDVIVNGSTPTIAPGPTLSYASATEFVVARPAPGRAQVASALPSALRGSTAPAPQIPAHSAEMQAEIRRLYSSPTVAADTTLRAPEMRRFAAFVGAPRHIVASGFGRDASNGLSTRRFSGAAVVAIPVVRTAAVIEGGATATAKRKRVSMAGTGTTDAPAAPH